MQFSIQRNLCLSSMAYTMLEPPITFSEYKMRKNGTKFVFLKNKCGLTSLPTSPKLLLRHHSSCRLAAFATAFSAATSVLLRAYYRYGE